jgi:hypothetical protein
VDVGVPLPVPEGVSVLLDDTAPDTLGVTLAVVDLEGVALEVGDLLGEVDAVLLGVPEREGVALAVPDLDGVALGLRDLLGVPEPELEGVPDLDGVTLGVTLRVPDWLGVRVPVEEAVMLLVREGVPLRVPERDGDCDAVADGVLLGVKPKVLVGVAVAAGGVPLREGVGEEVVVLEALEELPEDEVGVPEGVTDLVPDLVGDRDLVRDLEGDRDLVGDLVAVAV